MDLKDLGRDFKGKSLETINKFLEHIPEEKRKPIIIIFGSLIFLCICIIFISLIFIRTSPSVSGTPGPGRSASHVHIPMDDLFFPNEPDFLPFLLLEREPRQPWTADDLRLFWTDPVSGYEEMWRDLAIETIDRLMEGVR